MHFRERHILAQFKKRQKIFPILGLVGARQTGKTTFLREVWREHTKGEYVTFDREATREAASRSIEQFLLSQSEELSKSLIIDEAHKVPEIFDALKVIIDERKKFKIFSLSGSVDFSQVGGVRESLTGRIGISKLFPFTLREVNNHTFASPFCDLAKLSKAVCKISELETWLEKGGMPSICGLRDETERFALIEEFLNSTCYRDLYQIKNFNPDGALAYQILKAVSRLPMQTSQEIARYLRASPNKVRKHLEALESIFIVHRLSPHKFGTGKPRYVIFDAGIGRYFGAEKEQLLVVLFLNEILAQHEYAGARHLSLHYVRTKNNSSIDFLIEDRASSAAICIDYTAKPSNSSYRALLNFTSKVPNSKGYILAPTLEAVTIADRITVIPWISVV